MFSTNFTISQSTEYKNTQNYCDDIEPEITDSTDHSLEKNNIAVRSELTATNTDSSIRISATDNAATAIFSDTSGHQYFASSIDNNANHTDRQNYLSSECIDSPIPY